MYSHHQCLRAGLRVRAVNTLGEKKSFPYITQILVGRYVAGRGEQMRCKINKFLKHTVFPPSTLGESRRKIADCGS